MTQSWIVPVFLTMLVVSACGSVSSGENLGEPVVTVIAKLDAAPAAMSEAELRATLVWLNGPPYAGERCEDGFCTLASRQYTVLATSDVAVEKQFPLTVKLGMFELPNPISGEYQGTVVSSTGELKLNYNSLPEAEVVLYEDRNANGKLDFVLPGQRGPSPDRVVALSSGIDERGVAVRTAIVNKRSPIPAGFANEALAPAFELFAFPLPKALTDLWPKDLVEAHPEEALFLPPGAKAPPVYDDGVYALTFTEAQRTGVKQHLLSSHNLVGEEGMNDAMLSWLATKAVEPIADAVVRLFPVDADRKSWLARACNPYDAYTNAHVSPPPGADIQCGAGALRYALNPDDYCGWTRTIDYSFFQHSQPTWWPCDEQGQIKVGKPYRAAPAALDEDLRSKSSMVLEMYGPEDLDCSGGRIHQYDGNPALRMPTAPPPAGSQIMCYGADAFSFMSPRSDGCRIKRTYEIKSEPDAAPANRWDLSASKPSWWPCDAQGNLRADTGYLPADVSPATRCATTTTINLPDRRLPRHARVRCDSANDLRYQPLWSDGCEPALFALKRADAMFTWDEEAPEWWPCDANGKFVPGKGYDPL